MITFSIITVVYNDYLHIAKTMQSVMQQKDAKIEYIIIDGNSSDGTKEKITKTIITHAKIIKEKKLKGGGIYLEGEIQDLNDGVRIKFLSQEDKGIFDAMNKGISLSTNMYINFLNCGDYFYSSSTLAQVATLNIKNSIIYGNLHVCYLDHSFDFIKKTSHNLEKLYRLFCDFGHPNCFIRTSLHQQYLYDTRYHLASDYDFIYKMYKNGYDFYFSDITITSFSSGGSSDINGFKSLREALKISLSYNQNSIKMQIKIRLFYFYALCKKIIKLYLPSKIIGKIFKKFR